MSRFVEGIVKYPTHLPCPEVQTDLVPRERRYISDIGQVKKHRAFQRDYQATRQNISFVFTVEQARDFQLWYKNDIIGGGAWFYADWPILHKEKNIAYRFVTRPVWKALARGNWHVSATVELDEGRKVGKYVNVFTTKIYPYIFVEGVRYKGVQIHAMPFVSMQERIGYAGVTISSGERSGFIYSDYELSESIEYTGITIASGRMVKWIYSAYELTPESIRYGGTVITEAYVSARLIAYDYFVDSVGYQGLTISSGEAK